MRPVQDGVKLDFAVIGFQKCGTASLRRLLREHPGVAVPDGELSPFLCSEPWGQRTSWEEYLEGISDQPEGVPRGTVDPTYALCDVAANARALHQHNPRMKIITIQRPRLYRAYSAWRMAALAGGEHRSFDDAIDSCLMDGPKWTEEEWLTQSYVEAGEYLRIRSEFSKLFNGVYRLDLHTSRVPQQLAFYLGIDDLGQEMPHEHRTEYESDPRWSRETVQRLFGHYMEVG